MRLAVTMSMTLDGVIQAPALPDEDERGGFAHGGWAVPYNDPVMGELMGEGMARTGALLLGRRTYESLYAYWTKQTDGNPFTESLNNTQKYVASRTLTEPLPWINSTLLEGDAVDAVARLKQRPGEDLAVIGSGELVQALIRASLVDAYTLLIHPIALGPGRRLFPDDGTVAKLRLVKSVPTTTGVLIATYESI